MAASLLLGSLTSANAVDRLGTWCRSTTPAFQIISDMSASDQADLLKLLARFEPVAAPYLPGKPVEQPSALRIVVFSRRSDFRKLTGKNRIAGFMQPSLQTNRLLIGPWRSSLTETLLHEYAHYLLRNRFELSLPTWFDEGLASFLGGIRFENSVAYVGELPMERMQQRVDGVPNRDRPAQSLARTLKAETVDGFSQRRMEAFYDWSWLLTHYLYVEWLDGDPIRGTELDAYLARGDQHLGEFLGISNRGLLRKLDRHLHHTPQSVRIESLPPDLASIEYECLNDFERDHELARAVLAQNPDGADRLLSPHKDSHSESPELLVTLARIALARQEVANSSALVEAALSREPLHAEALILQADLLIQNCLFQLDQNCQDRWHTARDLYRKGIRQDPNRFDGVLGLGLANLYTGRPGDAVNYLKVAYARAPWAAVVNYYLGESYRLIGDTRARTYLTNARNWARLGVWHVLAEESLQRLGTSGP